MQLVTLDASGCLGCLLMYKMCWDAPRDSYGCSRWPSMKLDVSNVQSCTICDKMHQGIFMDTQDVNRCCWMSIVAQVVPWCSNTFLWMFKMTLDGAGCLRCLSMDKLCLDAPTYYYGCWMLMMSFDAAGCLGCLSMLMNTLDASGCLDAQV